MTGLQLCLLGDFESRGPHGAPLQLAPRKVRALLSYLGFHLDKAVPRELLSSLIWGDISADEQARRSLRQALTTLRRELPDGTLEARRDAIMLRGPADVDVLRFEQAARQAERVELEQALELYRGELLEGFTARASGFDAWLQRERKRLQSVAANAMQRLCELQRGQGDNAASMATAMRLVATDPVRESAHRLLMELYAEAGRTSEAVRQFNDLRALLAQNLGTTPDAQTVDLLERIRRPAQRRSAPSVAVPPAGAPELRQVCVLAITPGPQRFDTALERDVEVTLARFGGSLTQVGEGRAVGVFGFPRAHHNDHERGVRAALALQRLEGLVGGATIGVASGPILVEYSGQEPSLRGDTLARASQLSQLSGAGVVITSTLAATLGERLESRPDAGEGEARWVTRYIDAAELPLRTPLVGRRYELAQLRSALELCLESGRGRTFVIRGEAGIGKTRLLRALSEIARDRGFLVHASSVVDFGDDAQEPPIQGLVRELLADDRRASRPAPPPAADALEEVDLSLLLDMAREVPREGSGYQAGGRALYLRRRRDASCRLLALCSAQNPRVVWIDDIHWADAETLAQIGAWTEVAASQPLLLVVTMRLEAAQDESQLGGLVRGRPVTTLDLAPLAADEARELIAALEPDDPQSCELVLARSGGNPLFIEQLLRCAHPGRLPAGISSLVQARCDQLEADDRTLLQTASVLGQHFTLPALSHLLEQDEPSMSRLIGQSLITENGDAYGFVHALVRDSIYDGLPPERRIRLHASAARYYAGRDAALHAEHLDYAGDEGASLAYVRAAANQRRAGNAEHALELCTRGRDLARRATERHTAALLLGELLIDVGRSEAALEPFAAAVTAASDAAARAQAHVGRAAALRILDRSQAALLELTTAERLLDPQREPALLSRIHYLRGNVLFPLGDWAACLQSQTLALEAARRTGSTLVEAQALSGSGDAHFLAGNWRTARSCFTRCEQAARQAGALELELTSRAMQYLLDAYDLSVRECATGCQEVSERARASGALRAEALSRICGAWALLALGAWEAALSEARRATAIADAIGAQRFSALGIAYAAIARARLGERQAAHLELGRALSLAQSSSMAFAGPVVYAALLATAEQARLAMLLDETDDLFRSAALRLSLVTFVLHATDVVFVRGDLPRLTRYLDVLEASMGEEPHALGKLLLGLGRALVAWSRDPHAESRQLELERLREELQIAGLHPSVGLIDQSLSRVRSSRRRRASRQP